MLPASYLRSLTEGTDAVAVPLFLRYAVFSTSCL